MAHPFVHVELNTGDVAKAKEFYQKLFAWKLEDIPMPGNDTYTMIDVGGGTGGGMLKSKQPGAPPFWLAYVGVDDIKASTKRARDLGAKIMVDVTEVGEHGFMSVFVDPTGAHLALWQPKQGAKH